jgi:hypothetical protein
MSDDIRLTQDDLARDLRADLSELEGRDGHNYEQWMLDNVDHAWPVAIRRALAAEAEVERWERLRQLIHDDARHIGDDACCVMANGTATPGEPPTYGQTVSVLRNTVASLEAENARLRAACLAGVAVTDDDGEA